MSIDEKLDYIISEINLIKNHFKIVPNRDITINDVQSSVINYETFASEDLKLNKKTITNHLSVISRFLVHSEGIITKQTVQEFLDSNESDSWKSNQLKALRKYIRDFLHLGNWINEFNFTKSKAKIKGELPTDSQLVEFCLQLPYQAQLVFLMMHNSGMRIGEITSLKIDDYNPENRMIDASHIHQGNTKFSWISYVTQQTASHLDDYFEKYFEEHPDAGNDSLFHINTRSVQNAFKTVSENTGIHINPHLLRTIFTEKCTKAGIAEKYINAFCGRVSQGMIAKHYTAYSPSALKEEYDKVESLLTLPF